MRHNSALLLFVFSCVTACGGSKNGSTETPANPETTVSPEASATPGAETAEDVTPANSPALTREDVGEEILAMLTALAQAAEAHKGDCETTAKVFRDVLANGKKALDAGDEMDTDPANRQWFEENYSYKYNNQTMLMKEHLEPCLSDTGFQKVLGEMNR